MAGANIGADKLYDVIVVGGGPAGLTAALYLARAKYRVLVVEKDHFGGQITITSEVVNYPGVGKTSGKELTETMRKQAESFGAEFMLTEVESIDAEGDIKTVKTARGEFKAFGILLATGAHPRVVGFKGEEENKGRGVAYCATCDGEFFTGKDVFVVGGGFAAAEESVFLTKFARKVTILMRGSDFSCAGSVADEARENEKITVIPNTEVEEVRGDNGLDYIRYRNRVTGEVTEFKAQNGESFGVFVFAGYVPATNLVRGIADLNEQDYVITDSSQKTSVDGLYAAGDVCIKPLRQVVTAVGDGALAATELEKYAAAMHRKTGLVPKAPEAVKPAYTEEPKKEASSDSGELFDDAMRAQLDAVFSRMGQSLLLKLYLDDRAVSAELEGYMTSLAKLTDKLSVEVAGRDGSGEAPCVKVCYADGTESGLAFHGVPGGHEFTSFVLGLYNAAGPGQAIDDGVKAAIERIAKPVDVKVFVSLSCTMCPELVTATQRIAAESKNVKAEVYDLNHFAELRDRYKVMSVPCLVVNDEHVTFGKKNISQVVEFISSL
ncbi:MAG: FAD-dependent oxidoreductase [Oscillospiraceae bacterium]|nr:FAD-dependent oxidoreductase [Oscillospiraceae bacterium]